MPNLPSRPDLPNAGRPGGRSSDVSGHLSGPVLTDAALREEAYVARTRLRLLLWLYADAIIEPAGRIAADASLRRETVDVIEELGAEVARYASLLRQGGWPVDYAMRVVEELVQDMPTVPDAIQAALREYLVRAARGAYRTPPERHADDELRAPARGGDPEIRS